MSSFRLLLFGNISVICAKNLFFHNLDFEAVYSLQTTFLPALEIKGNVLFYKICDQETEQIANDYYMEW